MEMNDLIKKAENAEQFCELLKEEGYTLEEEHAKKLFEHAGENDQEEVSEDELFAVDGGMTRDYAKEGCAASVRYGSDCWGTDGGCWVINIDYAHMPLKERCPSCGKQTIYLSHEGVDVYYYKCRSCRSEFISLPWKEEWEKVR